MSLGRRILLRVLLYGGAVLVALPVVFSQMLLVVGRRGGSATPPRGAAAVVVLSGELRLRGWFFDGSREHTPALVLHGLGDSIESYGAYGQTLARRGYPTLLLDLRAHGGSEGTYTTLGGREREDVRAGIAFLEGKGWHDVVLMGASLGAVSALRAAAGRTDVRAVVAEAPFDSYRATVAHHAWLYYKLPGWLPVVPMSVALAEWRGGFNADDIDVVAAARATSAPLLAIADGADPRMPEPVVRRVFEAHPGPKELWVAEGVGHAEASERSDYWPTVFGFLGRFGL
jgi:pimeloyl-ACP methyl ester carboxylesterase